MRNNEDNVNTCSNLFKACGLSIFSAGYGAIAASAGAEGLLLAGVQASSEVAIVPLANVIGAGAAGFATLYPPLLCAAAVYSRYGWNLPKTFIFTVILQLLTGGLAGAIGGAELGYQGTELGYIAASTAFGSFLPAIPLVVGGLCCEKFCCPDDAENAQPIANVANNNEMQPIPMAIPVINDDEMQPIPDGIPVGYDEILSTRITTPDRENNDEIQPTTLATDRGTNDAINENSDEILSTQIANSDEISEDMPPSPRLNPLGIMR